MFVPTSTMFTNSPRSVCQGSCRFDQMRHSLFGWTPARSIAKLAAFRDSLSITPKSIFMMGVFMAPAVKGSFVSTSAALEA